MTSSPHRPSTTPELAPDPMPRHSWSRARRLRATRHRVELPEIVRSVVVAQVEASVVRSHGRFGRRPSTSELCSIECTQGPAVAAELRGRRRQRAALGRLQARRDRLAARVRGVREPARHGALRKAILKLDASILALRRGLDPAA